METHSYAYKLGKKINLEKTAKKVKPLEKKAPHLLGAEIEGLTVHVTPSGRVRIMLPGKEFKKLKDKIFSSSSEINALLEEVMKANSIKKKVSKLKGEREKLDDYDQGVYDPQKEKVPSIIVRSIVNALYEMSGDFDAERILTQAGERAGRKLVEKENPKKKPGVTKLLVKHIKENQLGKAKQVKEKRRMVDVIIRVDNNAFTAGAPNLNKKTGHYIRGLLRGAFAEFKGKETVSVKESKSETQGNAYSEYEVYSLAA